jgi:hypothetical protein
LVGLFGHRRHRRRLLRPDHAQGGLPDPRRRFTQAYLYLTNRPSEGVSSEFNLVAGFPFQAGAAATVSVGGQVFDLFTENDSAWLMDPARSSNLAGAIRAGSSLTVDGVSAAGVAVTQIFSLSGATAAQRAIEGGC